MITADAIEAYNTRLTVDLNRIKTMKPLELDQVKAYGSQAENLLKNKELALMIHHFKFEVTDQISQISAHDPDSNAKRVALANQLTGIDQFVATLQRAVYMKNRVVTQQQEGPADRPTDVTKKAYSV